MTAIAGFRSFGIPVLIGDFLVTKPTEAAGESGLRKKLVVISDNCAVAWTGQLPAADSVIRSIQAGTIGGLITLESIYAILTDPATSEMGALSVRLIGWVIDDRGQHCFSWNSQNAHTVLPGAPAFDGSGAASIQQLVGNVGLGPVHDGSGEGPDPALAALQITTRLMNDELLGKTKFELEFGFAYEVALFRNQRFEYTDNILYLAITWELDEAGRYAGCTFVGSLYKYRVKDNFTQIHVYNPTTHVLKRHVVEPVGVYSRKLGDEMVLGLPTDPREFPWDSDYYCVFLQVNAPGFSKNITYVLDRFHSKELVDTSKPGEFSFNVPPEIIEWMTTQFLKIRNSRRSRHDFEF
jgi:hypothetical protein